MSPKKKPVRPYSWEEPQSWREALDHLIDGIAWFWKNKKVVVIFLFVPTIGQWGYLLYQNFSTDKVHFSKAKAARNEEEGTSYNSFTLMPQVFANDKKSGPRTREDVWIDGAYYGKQDTTFQLFKMKGSTQVLVNDIVLKNVFWADIEGLTRENTKQYKN